MICLRLGPLYPALDTGDLLTVPAEEADDVADSGDTISPPVIPPVRYIRV